MRGFSEQEQDGPFRVLTRILRRFVFLFRCIGGSLRAARAELSGSARQRTNEAAGGDRGGSIATYAKGAHKETGPMGGTESVVQALTGTEFASRMESIIYAAAQIPQGGVLLLHLSSALARHRIEVDRVERDVHFCRHRFCDGFLLLPNIPVIEKDMILRCYKLYTNLSHSYFLSLFVGNY